jgi:hypothetical protein
MPQFILINEFKNDGPWHCYIKAQQYVWPSVSKQLSEVRRNVINIHFGGV